MCWTFSANFSIAWTQTNNVRILAAAAAAAAAAATTVVRLHVPLDTL